MAKKAPKPKKSSPASASPSSGNPRTSSSGRVTLRVRSKAAKQQSLVLEKEKRPRASRKPHSKPKKADSKKPKKPPTAFFYFLEDFRKVYQAQNPEIKSMREIGKACGEKWKTMNYEEKVQYFDIATEKRAEFDRAMADYIKRQENGELDEDSEDSESD